jgi:DNA-binding transcriptional MerR regulator
MISIGHFAKLAKVSSRTLRYYESIGLIQSATRGENNYRYYDSHLVDRVGKIRDLQELGFTLEEIKEVLKISPGDFTQDLRRKLDEVEKDLEALRGRHLKLTTLLSVSQKIDSGESVNEHERKHFMEAVHEEILSGLRNRQGDVTEAQLDYLKRDRSFESAEQREFLEAIKKCVEFARSRGLKLGPGRGSSPASIVLYALGMNSLAPNTAELYPERLLTQAPNIHIDVEYERGQEFVDYCREITKSLKFGEIQAFKMPLLDILQNVDRRLGTPVPYDEIDDDADVVMNPFREGNIDKVFLCDMSEDTLIMKFENFLPGYAGGEKMRAYLKSQQIHNFRDMSNISILWRPTSQPFLDRLEFYRKAKETPFIHEDLASEIQKALRPNFGMILYQEDLLRIIAHYTHWDLQRCNQFRRSLLTKDLRLRDQIPDLQEFKKLAPEAVVRLVLDQVPFTFCLPHTLAFATLMKKTAVLKSLHQEIYYEEIQKWEQKHGLRWDDIGVAWKGVSLLQN